MQNIGVHFTIAKGFTYAAKTVYELGGSTFQFFSRNPRGSKAKVYLEKDIEQFQKLRKEYRLGPIMAHAPYTINLASTNESLRMFSRDVVKDDIIRMEDLGIEYYNLHPGNHLGEGKAEGISQIIIGLNEAITEDQGITVLLETMSGKGSEIGSCFEQLRQIIDGIVYDSKVGVCMDLCHMFSSGYDIVNHLDDVLYEFDKIIGIKRLKAVHLNDSKNGFNSRKDNHAPIGEGQIGLEATLRIMRHPQLCKLPFYLETPLDDEGHKQEILMLKCNLQ
ncbi:MAG: deoxyribonuclease IV [Mobilitalea sp.]